MQHAYNKLGNTLAIGGTIIAIVGTLVNNLWLDPLMAREIWLFSNPVFLAYFIGVDMGYWNGQHISTRAFILTYLVFTVTNIISFM